MKPILGSLKDSEEMLKFMNELSQFSKMFSSTEQKTQPKQDGNPQTPPPPPPRNEPQKQETEKKDEKNPQSPTSGIADDFIERCLQNYFKNR